MVSEAFGEDIHATREFAEDLLHVSTDWSLSFWVAMQSHYGRQNILLFEYEQGTLTDPKFVYVKDQSVFVEFYVKSRKGPERRNLQNAGTLEKILFKKEDKISIQTGSLASSNSDRNFFQSIQIVHDSEWCRILIYVNGKEVVKKEYREKLQCNSLITPRIIDFEVEPTTELNYGDLTFTTHALTEEESAALSEAHQESFPTDENHALNIVWYTLAVTVGLLLYGIISSVIAGSDFPNFESIVFFGLSFLDVSTDFQMAYQLYTDRDKYWKIAVPFCIFPC